MQNKKIDVTVWWVYNKPKRFGSKVNLILIAAVRL